MVIILCLILSSNLCSSSLSFSKSHCWVLSCMEGYYSWNHCNGNVIFVFNNLFMNNMLCWVGKFILLNKKISEMKHIQILILNVLQLATCMHAFPWLPHLNVSWYCRAKLATERSRAVEPWYENIVHAMDKNITIKVIVQGIYLKLSPYLDFNH